jgi:DNA-binding LytR/AlgR family response regulator
MRRYFLALRIAICEDIPADRQQLISFIKAEIPCCETVAYENGEALLWDFESGTRFDIIFLDIFMSGINGVEVARCVRTADPDILLIFVSSSDAFYRESYDLYAFNYLIKPLDRDRLTEVLHRAVEQLNKNVDHIIRISFNNSLHTIRCSQLLYLSSERHIVNFYLKSGEALKSYGKLDDYAAQLPAEAFMRCHQSYIVNLNHVTAMTTNGFSLDRIRVPISKSYLGEAKDKYRSHMFGDF